MTTSRREFLQGAAATSLAGIAATSSTPPGVGGALSAQRGA
ncbi:MAG: twin-arginine translocation signal domain-containing protein [Steroidobacteraceae bacterium]